MLASKSFPEGNLDLRIKFNDYRKQRSVMNHLMSIFRQYKLFTKHVKDCLGCEVEILRNMHDRIFIMYTHYFIYNQLCSPKCWFALLYVKICMASSGIPSYRFKDKRCSRGKFHNTFRMFWTRRMWRILLHYLFLLCNSSLLRSFCSLLFQWCFLSSFMLTIQV